MLRRPTWTDKPELMDAPLLDEAALRGNLADLARANRWLGGTSLTLQCLEEAIGGLPASSDLSILDIASGGADIPRSVADWAEKRGLQPRVVATDLNPQMVRLAREAGDGSPQLGFAAADARLLPFAAGSFDVVMCSLALHHLRPTDSVLMLCEMRRVARRAIIVNDLVRCWHGFIGGWLFGNLMTRNPFTRHDGPLSFRRAYTVDEMEGLARQAGLQPVRFRGFLGFRVCMLHALSESDSHVARAA